MVADATHAEVVICPPFVNLPAAVEAARSAAIEIGAQDVFWLKEGAYTGEVSAPMLVATGCRWVIIGHSERRQYFGETDETVFKKTVGGAGGGAEADRVRGRASGGARSRLDRSGAGGAVLGGNRRLDARAVRANRDRV